MTNDTKLLRIYTDEAAYFGDRKVFEVVASRARDAKLSGATVLEALLGFGPSAHVHRRHVLESDRAEAIFFEDGDDLADEIATDGIGLDDGEGAFNRHGGRNPACAWKGGAF